MTDPHEASTEPTSSCFREQVLHSGGLLHSCWLLAINDKKPSELRLFPDGFLDLVVALGPTPQLIIADQCQSLPGAFLFGSLTRPVRVRFFGPSRWLALRFRAAYGGAPELRTNSVLPVAQASDLSFLPREAQTTFQALLQRPNEATLWSAADSLAAKRPTHDAKDCVLTAMRRAGRDATPTLIQDLAADLGIRARQLHRMFVRRTGLSPKSFFNVIRFQHALRQIRDGQSQGLAQVAQACGYSDQAHMAREFRRFAGMSPSKFANTLAPRYRSMRQLAEA